MGTGDSPVPAERSSAALATNSLQVGLHGIVFLDHSSGHQATFVLWNNHLIGSRIAYRVRVTLLSRAGNDFHVWIQGSRGDCDVKIVRIIILSNADSSRALNSRGLQDIVTLRISLDDHDPIFQEFAVKPFVGFNKDKGNLEAV